MITAAAKSGTPFLVAADGAVLGVLACTVLRLPHRSKPLGRILAIVVDEGARRSGGT